MNATRLHMPLCLLVGLLFSAFISPCSAAEPGRIVPAGAGIGHWETYDVTVGLAGGKVSSIFQDRDGALWFGTLGGGVSKYDGHTWTTFTTDDGLADNFVWSIAQDWNGSLWFGTDGGDISKYDGRTWTTFTTENGLAHSGVRAILQDRDGALWFGTGSVFLEEGSGVSKYDGHTWTTFTTENGLAHNCVRAILQDRAGNLWFGTMGGVSQYDGHTWTTFTTDDGLVGNQVGSILQDRDGALWFGASDRGVSRYDGQSWTSFTTKDGLADNRIRAILQDRSGNLWFGTYGSGISRYDGRSFRTFTTVHGLAHNWVTSVFQDREGHLWMGTDGGGASRYDRDVLTTFTEEDGLADNVVLCIFQDRDGVLWMGTDGGGVSTYGRNGRRTGERSAEGTFTTFTKNDGLAGNQVRSILQDREGQLWFATDGSGVSRYNRDERRSGEPSRGGTFTTFTEKHGLASNHVSSVYQDRDGAIWFGTGSFRAPGKGVSKYDPSAGSGQAAWTTYTTAHGLPENTVSTVLQDRDGAIWFGTTGGACRYDGARFEAFTVKDGLADNRVRAIYQDREGHLWFGTEHGVGRYDGKTFASFTTRDGLADNQVRSIFQDREGHLWFGTLGGGVNRYDKQVFQKMDHHDGLGGNGIYAILQDQDGAFWFSTLGGGVTRYRPPHPWPPPVYVDAVTADRRYEGVSELAIPSSVGLVAFEFHGISFKTRPEAMVYRYRLKGYDADWRATRNRRVEYQDLPENTYVFEVQGVDRDLVYTDNPAAVALTVHPPYGTIALGLGLGLALVGVAVATGIAVRRRRERDRAQQELIQTQARLMEEMEKELQTAHEMQMGLMPAEQPRVSGFDIAGRCRPASHVGGDFFQYFPEPSGRFAITLADVTGHGMGAAIPAVLFSGILGSQMEIGGGVHEIFARLNRSLHRTLESGTFVCVTMGEIDLANRVLRLVNSACPYPYHFRAETEDVAELELNAYPMGILENAEYQVMELPLRPGDRVIFCSDGIVEAENPNGDQFGFECVGETLRQGCEDNLSADRLIDRLLETVDAFRAGADQIDDITCVVLRVE